MDINTIWERLKYDYKYGLFIKHPYEFQLYENDKEYLEKDIYESFKNQKYITKSAFYCNVPKKGGLIRPGSYLTLEDHLYYLYLVSCSYKNIFEATKWSQDNIDFAYSLTGEEDSFKWLANQFSCWNKYRLKSLEHLDEGYPYVIITDITGYYENIDHSLLYSELKNIGVNDNIALQIKNCLKKWAIIQGKGIPQSCSSSHILAKLYLNSTDMAIHDLGIVHVRYVDDIRIFCKSKHEAKQALMKLIELTRNKGLNLQSAKTKILRSEEARKQIEGIQLTIESIAKKIIIERPITIPDISPSLDFQTESEIKFNLSSENVEVLQETFRAYFIQGSEDNFDKTLYHYLLNRLSDFNNNFGVDYSLSILENHPEETEYILKYCLKVKEESKAIEAITAFLKTNLSVYSFQNYQLIKWVNDTQESIPSCFLEIIRLIKNTKSNAWYLKAELNRTIGLFGNPADLENILSDYPNCRNDTEKAETMFNLKRLEKSKRNSFYSKTNKDCRLVEIAQKIIK